MELNEIATFVKIAQTSSLTGAARQLGMPSSTVSNHLARLEKRLGVTLFQRTTRKIHLTEAGETYFKKCVVALEDLSTAEQELKVAQREPTGLLKVTSAADVGHTFLPLIVEKYLRAFPKMRVELVVTNRVVDLVAENVDVGIRATELEDSTLIARKIVVGNLGIYASEKYLKKFGSLLHPKQLSDHDILEFTPMRNRDFRFRKGNETALIKNKGCIAADDFECLQKFSTLGMGVCILPSFILQHGGTEHGLVRVCEDWVGDVLGFHLVYPAQRFVSPKVKAFLDLAVKFFAECKKD